MSNQSKSSQISSVATMVALYEFTAEESSEMSMRKNDIVDVLDMDPALNGWAYARRRKDNKEGYVPVSYLGSKPKVSGPTKQNKATAVAATESPGPSTRQNKRGFIDEDKKQQHSSISPQMQSHGNGKGNSNPAAFRGNNVFTNGTGHGRGGGNNGYHHGGNSQNHDTSNMQHHNVHQPTNNNNNNNNNGGRGMMHQGNSNSNNNANGGPGGPPMVRTRALKLSQLNEHDPKVMVCSFHRDFIPSADDLHRYFGSFGKITNQLEIQHDSKRVPLARIRFQSEQSADAAYKRGNRQQIPSATQGGNIHVRVWRSMQQYSAETSRRNRGNGRDYNRRNNRNHNNNRRGGNF